MFIAYDGIVFDVLLLNDWQQTAIKSEDKADFLYWHHVIDVTCILNPNVVTARFFPNQTLANQNKQAKAKRDEQIKRLGGRDRRAKEKGLIDPKKPGSKIGEVPSKSPIKLPGQFYPRTDLNDVPNPAKKVSYFTDSVGTISTKTDETSNNYPPAVVSDAGVPYAPDVAAKTGPIEEPISYGWADDATPVSSAPASVEETVTKNADNPVPAWRRFANNPPQQPKEQNVLDRFFIGRPRPPLPEELPPPSDKLKDPPNSINVRNLRVPDTTNMPATDIELRDRLQVPRRKLQVWINTGVGGTPEYILNLPYDGCTVDACNGPSCVEMPLKGIHGNVTGVKRLVFECFEALPLFYGQKKRIRLAGGRIPGRLIEPGRDGIPQRQPRPPELLTPPLISNRWTMRQIPDTTTHLNSTEITGKAIFRMDVLSKMRITPDQLRQYIMPPVASGYVRRPPVVGIGSLGNEVVYTIIDDQQMMNNPAGQRWGVHSVVVTDSCFANNPYDITYKNFKPEKERG